ncbi:efflux RND transporter permease subunit [Acidipila sp. EB88]|uniref:efflux RND transporter permease subunit n=1 Tax=Acidipila sp. EB88 TaxID=2305226 RepID=UPI003512E539
MTPPSNRQFWLIQAAKPLFFCLVLLTAAGIYAAFQVPISVFPETTFPRIVIGIDNGVMPVEQMQVTITRPIEEAVNTVPGLKTVRSTTSRGSAEVSLFFDWNVDMFQTLQLTDAALSKVQSELPITAKITTNRLTFATFPIVAYALTADERGGASVSQTALWQMATYQLKPSLSRVPGVSTVSVQGGQVPEFHIIPDLGKLQITGATVPDIVNSVQSSNIIDSPGLYEADHQLILGLVGAQAHDTDGLGQLIVKTTAGGNPVRLADVATVASGTLPAYTAVAADARPAVLLNITRQPSSNAVAVAGSVATQVDSLSRTLPAGVHLTAFYDQSELVHESIASVRDAILAGLLLACVVLWLFLGDWAASMVAGMVIPVTVAITVLFLWAIGQSFNLMTLGGLAAAIGLVIDDAIVVVENIVVHRDEGESRVEAVRLALREIMVPLIGSTITPIVIFLPLIGVTGVTGSFFRALAMTMGTALLTSLLLALSFTPALSLVLLHESGARMATGVRTETHGAIMRRTLRVHGWLLERLLDRSLAILAIAALLLVSGYFAYGRLGSNLLPAMDEGAFVIDYIMPAGSSIATTTAVLDKVDRVLHGDPDVLITTRRTGLQLGLAAVTEANTGDISVRLKPGHRRSFKQISSDLRAKINGQAPQLDVEFVQVLEDMIGDLSNSPEPIQIKLFSNDTVLLHTLAPRVKEAIAAIPGVVDTQNGIDNTLSGPATYFQVDPSIAGRLGFTPQEVAEDATSLLDGLPTNAPLIMDGRPYTIRVRLGSEHRASLDAIRNTLFRSVAGHTASLGDLAQISELPPQNEIRRENLEQVDLVSGRLEGSDLGGAMAKVKAAIAGMHLPASVRVEFGGTYQEQQRSFSDLARVLLLALALVFGVLLTEFRNFAAPSAILVSSVLSITGVLFALAVTGTDFNVASFMGLIMVIGIAAKNGILLLDADERAREEALSPRDAIVQAARRRLRPILATAVAAMCGMAPLALGIGAGSQMLQPLAIAVVGGLLFSVPTSLLLTPALYYQWTRRQPRTAPVAPRLS